MSKSLTVRNVHAVALTDQLTMAKAFYASGIFQDVKDEAQALVKIAKGQEIGLPPVTAMESIDILEISGKKSLFLRANACAALVRACGYGDYTVLESSPVQCVLQFSKKTHEGWVDLHPITYTLELAKKNKLIRTDGQWDKDPENMLYQRAMKRGVERYFPELVKGLAVSDEAPEVTDETFERNVQDLFGQEDAPVDTTVVEEKEPDAAPVRVVRRMWALIRQNKILEEQFRAYIQREFNTESTKTLLHGDVSRIIDLLEAYGAEAFAVPVQAEDEEEPMPEL